ncbi:MAG TPA: hypothetical protein VGE30_01195 [Candidatus Saccharimonadales bacterium]
MSFSRVRKFNWTLLLVCFALFTPVAYFALTGHYNCLIASIGFGTMYCFYWFICYMAMHDVYPEEIGYGPFAYEDDEASSMRRRRILTLAPFYYALFEVRHLQHQHALSKL